ncbi:SRPBCC family protein [Natronolimnohabitans sp. A-GB9]|uniref:SRPBCC family protein n=1 Tax=Natronolimnohabitans sp. A-GB9 TaxID=3069757 RepID=UPI0027B2EB9B|nr:SRPBCC family protein [Natronolimnohabitans sp. A-GB9]MDQ2051245.1 SRPBCC family protein [Natronolimnohabitans sp. A-GB9]
MREVTVDRVVDATPAELSEWLDPPTIVRAEGSFDVAEVDDRGDAVVVVASGPGMALPLRFEDRDGAIYYTQEGEQGPFEAMETWIELEDAPDGTRVRLRSSVSLAAPLPFGDRIAAWKRNGELNRLLDALEDAF